MKEGFFSGGSPMKSPLQRFFSNSEPESTSLSPFSSEDGSPAFESSTGDHRRGKSSSFAFRVRDHVRMGSKLSETVKGKLSLGAKIIREGGRANIFKQVFETNDAGEKLLKASQCYLSTGSGPVSGLLFISNKRLAFCSDRSFTFTFPHQAGKLIKALYKISIPIKKIKNVNQSENVNNPAQKFMEMRTEDDHEFWFMGFLRYEAAYKNLQKAIEMANQI